jgi:predicted transcriptional regulator
VSKSREIVEHLASVEQATVSEIADAVDHDIDLTRALVNYLAKYGRIERANERPGAPMRITEKGRQWLIEEAADDDISPPPPTRMREAAVVIERAAHAAPRAESTTSVAFVILPEGEVGILIGDIIAARLRHSDARAVVHFLTTQRARAA